MIDERTTAEEILNEYAANKQKWTGWEGHVINFKVGPGRADLHSAYDAFRGVYSVRVKAKHRGQGHGRALMDVIVAYAEATGVGLFLDVLTDNEPAVRLYRSVGFRPTGGKHGVTYMRRYPSHIPSTPEWDHHFEQKAKRLEQDHEPRLGGDFWVAFFDDMHAAQKEIGDLGRERYASSPNYRENSRRLYCDAEGAALAERGWIITRNTDTKGATS